MKRVRKQLAAIFDRIISPQGMELVERVVLRFALFGFFVHLAIIAFVRSLPDLVPSQLEAVGTNYLEAIYTPFSFILFHEVLLMVVAIPTSLTTSIIKQYEIISLIIIRRVFKDVGGFSDMQSWIVEFNAAKIVLMDMSAALFMFFLIAVFHRVRSKLPVAEEVEDEKIKNFIEVKKSVALVLAAVLVLLAIANLYHWLQVSLFANLDGSNSIYLEQYFFPAFFEFMIFTDVFLLILSIAHYDDYEYLFRNSGFIISTVLLRISLSTPKPYDLVVSVLAIVYGLILVSVFALATSMRVRTVGEEVNQKRSGSFRSTLR